MTDILRTRPPPADPPTAPSTAPSKPPRAGRSFLARVRRHLAVLIVAKIVFLVLLYALFFSPSQRLDVTPERVDRLLFPTE